MDIFHLKCFLELADQQSFVNAAYALYIEPSTLSKIISKLEQEMNAELFTRTTRKVRLTEAGRSVYNDIKGIVELSDGCLSKVSAISKGASGNLNISYCGDVEFNLLPQTVRSFLSERPDSSIRTFRYTWRQISNFANLKQMDLGLVLNFGMADFSQMHHEKICDDPFAAVLPFDHPLATRESLSIHELLDEQFCFANREMSLSVFYHSLSCIFPEGAKPNILSQDNNMEEVLLRVACGLGISVVTLLSTNFSPWLKYVPVSDIPPAQLIAMWMPDNKNPLILPFVNSLKKQAELIRQEGLFKTGDGSLS